MRMKIAVSGLGYVGLSNAILLAQHNKVIAFDIDPRRVELINSRKSPFEDAVIADYLASHDLDLRATLDSHEAYNGADFVIIATPTDYDPATNNFNTESVESVIEDVLSINPATTIVIKSTVPVGYTNAIRARYKTQNIIFSPEFLREGQALHDNLNPSRIIIGDVTDNAKLFSSLLAQGAEKKEIPVLYTSCDEAEAIKLFANTYLALRISYFNELDTYSKTHGLDTRQIITGVCLDPRIGAHYNNPSFGYGGYCLPKDTRQLLANYHEIPQRLIHAVVESNATRKSFIAADVMKANPKTVGIYRLIMKVDSDNFRETSITDVVQLIAEQGCNIVIYEPGIEGDTFMGHPLIQSLEHFKASSDVILANRLASDLDDVLHRVYSRDIFGSDQ